MSDNLENSLANSAKATLRAIEAQEAALQAILQHTHKLKEAMETEVLHIITANINMYALNVSGLKNNNILNC